MKFDVVVGNPPYQAFFGAKNIKLWYKFSEKMINLFPKWLLFVTPDGALSDSKNGELLHNIIKKNNFGFVEAKLHINKKYFTNVGVNTCHWIIKHKSDNLINPLLIERKKQNDIIVSICNKVVSYKKKLPISMQNGHISKSDLTENGNNKIFFSGQKLKYTNKEVDGINQLKLVFPFSVSYHKAFITKEAVGMLNHFMIINNEDEGNFILSYAMSPLFKLVANFYKKTSGFTPFVKNGMIPDLRGKEINNLYQHFNLTQEEIDYIEKSVK